MIKVKIVTKWLFSKCLYLTWKYLNRQAVLKVLWHSPLHTTTQIQQLFIMANYMLSCPTPTSGPLNRDQGQCLWSPVSRQKTYGALGNTPTHLQFLFFLLKLSGKRIFQTGGNIYVFCYIKKWWCFKGLWDSPTKSQPEKKSLRPSHTMPWPYLSHHISWPENTPGCTPERWRTFQ